MNLALVLQILPLDREVKRANEETADRAIQPTAVDFQIYETFDP